MPPYYRDEHITLYHGDATTITAWTGCDVLVTDPPYGQAWNADAMNEHPNRRKKEQSVRGDEDTTIRDQILEIWGTTKPAIVFGTWRKPRPAGDITHRLIWHKNGRYPGISTAPFYPNDEEIYLTGTGWQGKPHPTVITTTEQRQFEPAKWGHPTPKPVTLMELLITKSPAGAIADPFAGSGATLIAARNLGRHAIGVEIEEHYCEIIANRLSQTCLDLGGI
jgi:hypothetical protein